MELHPWEIRPVQSLYSEDHYIKETYKTMKTKYRWLTSESRNSPKPRIKAMRARIAVLISRGHLNEILLTDTGTWHFLGEFLRPKLFYKLTKVASIQIG